MEANSITALSKEVSLGKFSIIAIDGHLGVGKTTIAKLLSNQLGFECIHLDNFLSQGKGLFVKNLDFLSLKLVLRKRPVLIEGICMLEVLEKLDVSADLVIYVNGAHAERSDFDGKLFDELSAYTQRYNPLQMAGVIFNMNEFQGASSDAVDIAYIKAKTIVSVTLAIGGILSILVGALVFVLGLESADTALIKLAGIELSAKGIGGVILITSAVWAYIAYLARPIYRRQHQTKEITNSDGTVEKTEFVSTTQMSVRNSDDA
jgi:hypothetical protein